MQYVTCWTLFISRINRAWLYKGHEDSGWQLSADLAQLAEYWPEDLEVLVSNPTGGNFWRFFFALSYVKICQIIWQKRLSWAKYKNTKIEFKYIYWWFQWIFKGLQWSFPYETLLFSSHLRRGLEFIAINKLHLIELRDPSLRAFWNSEA